MFRLYIPRYPAFVKNLTARRDFKVCLWYAVEQVEFTITDDSSKLPAMNGPHDPTILELANEFGLFIVPADANRNDPFRFLFPHL